MTNLTSHPADRSHSSHKGQAPILSDFPGPALVTGGAGFIGSHLAEKLASMGSDVTVLDNLSSGRRSNLLKAGPKVRLVEGDVRDGALVNQLAKGMAAVFHLAAMTSVPLSQTEPETCLDNNGLGTLTVMRACVEAKVPRLVYASSSAVYGHLEGPHSEALLPQPNTPYAAIKLLGEHLGLSYRDSHGLITVSLRYFNVYGPRQSAEGADAGVVPIFVKALSEGRSPVIYGDGTQTRDFIHVTDVVRATVLAALASDPGDGIFNVATGRQTSVLEVLSLLSHSSKTPKAIFEPPRAGDTLRSRGLTQKAEAGLGFTATIDLQSGLLDL